MLNALGLECCDHRLNPQEYLAIGQGYNYEEAGTGLIASRRMTDRRTSATRDVRYSYTFYPQGNVASKTTSVVIPGGTANVVKSYDSSENLIAVTDEMGHQSLSGIILG